jgi:hypothetical protein
MSGIATEDDDMTKDTAAMSAPSAGSPTHLTQKELEAIANGASSLESEAMRQGHSFGAAKFMREHAATLRRIIERAGK